MTVYQLVFAIAKRLAWTWHDEYGEEECVVLLRCFHTEMAFLCAIGNFLKGSGRKDILTSADVSNEGRVDGI